MRVRTTDGRAGGHGAEHLQRVDPELAQRVAAGVATGDAHAAQAGTLDEGPHDLALLGRQAFAHRAGIDAEASQPLAGRRECRVVGSAHRVEDDAATSLEVGNGVDDGGLARGVGRRGIDQRGGVEPGACEAMRDGPVDLRCRSGGGTARHHGDAVGRPQVDGRRLRRQLAGRPPVRHQRVLEPGGGGGETSTRAGVRPNEVADDLEVRLVDDVEQDHLGAGAHQLVEARGRVLAAPLDGEQIDQVRALVGLQRQVPAQVALGHRGGRMAAHRRVAVEPDGLVVDGGEEVAERLVALEVGGGDDHRHEITAAGRDAEVEGAADAAQVGRRVEGRADLVVHEPGAEVP